MRLVLAIACLVACDRRAPIRSCADDLTGEYIAGDLHWMVLDHGPKVEAYPLFRDVPPGELEIAPRVVELVRESSLVGEVRRRYMQGSAACVAKLPARVTACANDGIEIVMAEPSPPLAFAPCTWPRPESSRLERWRRR